MYVRDYIRVTLGPNPNVETLSFDATHGAHSRFGLEHYRALELLNSWNRFTLEASGQNGLREVGGIRPIYIYYLGSN